MKSPRLVLALALLMALLAACGGDTTATTAGGAATTAGETPVTTAGSTETTSAPEVTTGELIPVRLQLQWVTQAQFAGYFAAIEQGFYTDAGLDVTILEGAVDIVPQQVVAAGGAEFGLAWVPKALVSPGGGSRHRQHRPGLPALRERSRFHGPIPGSPSPRTGKASGSAPGDSATSSS